MTERNQRHTPADTGDPIRELLLTLNQQVVPFREWLTGQRAYFTGQGYTDDESRAMAAALFVAIFGSSITRTTGDGNNRTGDIP